MPILLYNMMGSPPCHGVRLLANTLGVQLEIKELNYEKGEHKTPEFLEINPLHTVPTINDNGFIINESRAILGYLVEKYAKDDSLYPKDPQQRALINQKLYYDMGTLYQPILQIIYGDPSKKQQLEEAFQVLDKYLNGQDWVTGKNISIADYSILMSVATAEGIDFDVTKYPHVNKWYKKGQKTIPGYEEIATPLITEINKYYKMLNKS